MTVSSLKCKMPHGAPMPVIQVYKYWSLLYPSYPAISIGIATYHSKLISRESGSLHCRVAPPLRDDKECSFSRLSLFLVGLMAASEFKICRIFALILTHIDNCRAQFIVELNYKFQFCGQLARYD